MQQAWDKGRARHADHEVLTPGLQVMGTEAQPDLVPNPHLGLQLEILSTSRGPGELRDKEAGTRPQAFPPQLRDKEAGTRLQAFPPQLRGKEAGTRPQAFPPQPDGHRDRPRPVADVCDQLGLRSCMRTQEYGPSKLQRRRHLGRSVSQLNWAESPEFPDRDRDPLPFSLPLRLQTLANNTLSPALSSLFVFFNCSRI